jgi:SIR2-like domain
MSQTRFKKDDILHLLGAGASVDANIPASQGMIKKIEDLLENDSDWTQFRQLYYYIKSSILFADGIKGRFDGVHYNVESLVNTLDELRRWEEHPLYPFVGAWNPKLLEVAGSNLTTISDFRKRIVVKLRDDWVQLKDERDASYYQGLKRFRDDYEYPLRVFTLNYDLCVEKGCKSVRIERGFDENRKWDWRRFSSADGSVDQKEIYLYKMHGSVDWTWDKDGILTHSDACSKIDIEKLAIIFGVTYKLQYVDPFLFFAYELRRWTLDQARLIITVGYGFADEHINAILRQALDNDPKRRLLIVSPSWETGPKDREKEKTERLDFFRKRLNPEQYGQKKPDWDGKQLTWWPFKTSVFFQKELTRENLEALFPQEEDLFGELPAEMLPATSNRPRTKKGGQPKRKEAG